MRSMSRIDDDGDGYMRPAHGRSHVHGNTSRGIRRCAVLAHRRHRDDLARVVARVGDVLDAARRTRVPRLAASSSSPQARNRRRHATMTSRSPSTIRAMWSTSCSTVPACTTPTTRRCATRSSRCCAAAQGGQGPADGAAARQRSQLLQRRRPRRVRHHSRRRRSRTGSARTACRDTARRVRCTCDRVGAWCVHRRGYRTAGVLRGE